MDLDPRIVDAVAAELATPIRAATWLAGGYSTGNWRLARDAGPPLVLRRYRPGRDACAVEAGLLERVAGVVPVPEVVLADPDGRLAGEPVLVTAYVDGVPADRVFAGGSADDVAAVGRCAGAALARLGDVTFAAAGFFTGRDLAVEPLDPAAYGVLGWVRDALDRAAELPGALEPEVRERWWELVAAAASALDGLPPARSLVHSDYNPKNLLVARGDAAPGGGWRLAAVLDWEFAYAGQPLADVGNWLRFAADRPPAYADAFVAAYADDGGALPPGWETAAGALDAMALADFLARADSPYRAKAAALVRRAVARGAL